MRIVDDEHELLAAMELVDEEGVQHIDQFDLFCVERIQAELDQNRLQELLLVELCLEYLRDQHVVVEL